MMNGEWVAGRLSFGLLARGLATMLRCFSGRSTLGVELCGKFAMTFDNRRLQVSFNNS
ncbi:hypothetical protein PR003_g18180 [Phytophthora rubi]|uniref:Uncharacterized protein n=1 Tax=Phytophthora rubi TaxID=129364 RepID=A0A6A3KFH1_9STRA|nr:hypothetical protein PR002_g17573 [Phytophthora rubi]KAE9005209.1 hypothetical protein PR001_g17509 [Phytophthora rubi]KAE9318650.1 hypothetical protein PR003_g18180 [Phytophthora rubi]